MNAKATKQQVKWPPLLNLSNDKPHIDETFQNWEKVNGPILNDMLQPVYTKDLHRLSVFDKKGHEYYMTGGSLVKDGTIVASNYTNGFTKTELTIDPYTVAAAYNGDDFWNVIYHPTRRQFMSYKNGVLQSTSAIYVTQMQVLDARLKFVGGVGVFVAYVDYTTEICYIYDVANMGTEKTRNSQWWNQRLVSTGSTIVLNNEVTNVSPCIHIGYSNGIIGVTVTGGAGKVIPMDTEHTVYMTCLFKTDWTNLTWTPSWDRPRSNKNATITIPINMMISQSEGKIESQTITVVGTNSSGPFYFYQAGATKLEQLTQYKITIYPQEHGDHIIGTQVLKRKNDQGEEVDTTYNVYQFKKFTKTFTRTVKANQGAIIMAVNAYWHTTVGLDFSAYEFYGLNGCWVELLDNNVVKITQAEDCIGVSDISMSVSWIAGSRAPTITPMSTSIDISWDGSEAGRTTASFDASVIDSGKSVTINLSKTYSPGDLYDYSVVPNVMLDDGYMYPLFYFTPQTIKAADNCTNWSNGLSPNYKIPGKCSITMSGSQITFTPVTSTTLPVFYPRSGSFVIDQGIFEFTFKLNNDLAVNPVNLATNTNIQYNQSGTFAEVEYAMDQFRYGIGTARLSSYNYYAKAVYNDETLAGSSEDLLVFTPGGISNDIGNYRILANVFTSGFANITGISYRDEAGYMGTLLTPWLSIDGSSYIDFNGGILYRDKSGKWYRITRSTSTDLSTILEDRVVLINTGSYWNAYDSEAGLLFHYASDYNGRMRFGNTSTVTWPEAIPTAASTYSAYPYIRYTANAVNPLFETMPRYLETSMMLPITPRYRCYIGRERFFDCQIPNIARQTSSIDVFYSSYGDTVCTYRYSFNGGRDTVTGIKNTLQGLTYPSMSTTASNLNPSFFAKYINGAGNNDVVLEGHDAYTLTYYDNNPTLLYSSTTQVSNLYGQQDVFFVLQGQFYGVIGDKLYSLLYSGGAVSQMDAIIDLGDLQFIGNNPMIAFFYDPATRVIRSFTGDANMDTLYSSTKITNYSGLHWYDETTQSIYAATNAGLLVIGPKNVYLHEQWKNVTNCQFDDKGITHITNAGNTVNLTYYEEGDVVVPLDLETSFWGLGSNELTTIDRWNITLYDLNGEHPESYITVGVRSITDVTVKSEEKTIKITPDMYDNWSNSVLISYNPKLIKGQGIRLYLKTPLVVQKVVPHIMDDKTGTVTGRNRSI